MNENNFLDQWEEEKPMYKAWGDFILSEISNKLEETNIFVDSFFKNTPQVRLKDNKSIIDKAFYRDKQYASPYVEIEDKVGLRFVVLLLEEIETVTQIIESSDKWACEKSRHFEIEREESPLLFTYQSVHYIVKSKIDINYPNLGLLIKAETPCEIQIRTLLQHAYAELTHNSVYKRKTRVEPQIQRTIAKSMALIETTDDFFSDVSIKLNSNIYDTLDFQGQLDELYIKYVDSNYSNKPQKLATVILDEFQELISSDTIQKIEILLQEIDISAVIKDKQELIYRQSIVIFVFYLIKRRTRQAFNNWPLDRKIIEKLATNIGVSLDQYR